MLSLRTRTARHCRVFCDTFVLASVFQGFQGRWEDGMKGSVFDQAGQESNIKTSANGLCWQ